MSTKPKTAGKTATSSKATVVNYGTTKQKVDYIPAGVAAHTKDRKNIIVYLKNGDKLIISKPVSDKQFNYFKETTAEGYVDHNDTNRIYMYSEYVVKHIKETDYNEDLQAAHQQEKQPKEKNKVETGAAHKAASKTTKKGGE